MDTDDALRKALAAVPAAVVKDVEYAKRGFDLDVSLPPGSLLAAVKTLDQAGYFIESITGVDWLGENEARIKEAKAAAAAKKAAADKKLAEARKAAEEAGEPLPEAPVEAEAAAEEPEPAPAVDDLEAVYDFNHYAARHRVTLRVRTPRDKPRVPSIVDIYQAAHWHERETHDFFGIVFEGHGYLVPLLLPEDADFHPLLKDYRA